MIVVKAFINTFAQLGNGCSEFVVQSDFNRI